MESFERIHRSNLIGLGVLPLEFLDGDTRFSLDLTGRETYNIEGLQIGTTQVEIVVTELLGKIRRFNARVCIYTPMEWEYLRHGGILPCVLRQLAK